MLILILTNRKNRSEHEHNMLKLIQVYNRMVRNDLNRQALKISIDKARGDKETDFRKSVAIFKQAL